MLQVEIPALLVFTTPTASSREHDNSEVIIVHATGGGTGTA